MTREEASAVLGGAKTSGEASVAFRELSKTCHPDSATPNAELWTQIREARDVLSKPARCSTCNGAGRYKQGALNIQCPECRGEGYL